jgi:hypothetical protein
MREMMQWRSELLIAQRYEDLGMQYCMPLVLFREDDQLVVNNREDLAVLFAKLNAQRHSAGIVEVTVSITAMDIPRNGRFRVWTRSHEMDMHGTTVSHSDAVYYCRLTPEGLRSEMVEYITCSIPEIWENQNDLALHLA